MTELKAKLPLVSKYNLKSIIYWADIIKERDKDKYSMFLNDIVTLNDDYLRVIKNIAAKKSFILLFGLLCDYVDGKHYYGFLSLCGSLFIDFYVVYMRRRCPMKYDKDYL